MSELELEFNADNSQIGFRLQYMELMNWGTFHEKIWRIEPGGNNSLLTGSIGSGKSTLVDALTCLIVPHQNINFNKAANADRKERSLISYIKGYYKFERDEIALKGKAVSLRYKGESDSTFTVILANFGNKGYDTNITLGQVFWIENEKPQKLLLISIKPLTIREYFSNIGDAKELRKKLKGHAFIELFDDNFLKYSQKFRQLFGMTSDKAIELFYQTVSMKSVSSLTSFVREQMLEKTDVKTQIDELKKRFDDLNKAYAAVQEARRQRDILMPLADLNKTYGECEGKIHEIDGIVQSIPAYFASQKIGLLENEIKVCEGRLNQLSNQLEGIERTLETKRDAVNRIKQDIRSSGGERIEQIANEISQREISKAEKKRRYEQYSENTSACDLPKANTDKTFYSNLNSAKQKIIELKKIQDEKLEGQAVKAAEQRTLKEQIEGEESELESLKGRENQIPLDFLIIRKELAADLGISQDEIPFAGELLRVKDDEKDWEGALERLLRGFGVSMLVPERYYKQISRYVNERRLKDARNKGMRFEYFKSPHNFRQNKFQGDIDPDSAVNKIAVKPNSDFEGWLEAELQKRFDLKCVSLEEFQRQSDVITKEGQIKTGSHRHIKDDRRELWDRRNFVLGWSNKEKIVAIEKHVNDLKKEKGKVDESLLELRADIDKNTVLNTKLNLLAAYTNWNELNWQDEAREISRLEREKKNLENSSDVLKELQIQLHFILDEIKTLDANKNAKTEDIGGLKNNIDNCKAGIESCTIVKGSLLQDEVETYFPKIDELLKESRLTLKNVDAVASELNKKFTGKNGEKDKLNERLSKTGREITKVMKEFKDIYPSESLELSVEIEARAEYLKILGKIISEGLPAHEERFKKMLNENTINDIVAFDNKLDNHFKSIKKKIEEINKHLKEIEFNKGTYIELLDDRNVDPEINDFKRKLKECYGNIMGTGDAYTEERFEKVKVILDRFRSNENRQIEWANKVTDVRNWFIFNASEKYLEDDSEKEFYHGTTGKSGGQKEKLAYTILASALAYQFGLTYGEPRSKSFRFVVIDEAFGRGDDESTQFGLGLFKKLNLQLLIVTPLQKIHIIENYINAVHYVSNTNGSNSEIQNLTVEEYKKQKLLHNSFNAIEATPVV
jgi:uncharacterized protein YPO0396